MQPTIPTIHQMGATHFLQLGSLRTDVAAPSDENEFLTELLYRRQFVIEDSTVMEG